MTYCPAPGYIPKGNETSTQKTAGNGFCLVLALSPLSFWVVRGKPVHVKVITILIPGIKACHHVNENTPERARMTGRKVQGQV